MILFILILVGFVSSMALTFLVRQYALRFDIIDQPISRSSHKKPTPRGGGLSIVITYQILIVISLYAGLLETQHAVCLAIPALFVAVVGFIDDHRSINLVNRLIVHFASAILAIYLLPGLPTLQLGNIIISSPLILYPIFTLGLVWLLNLYNFMDGIDGIAGSEAITVIISAAIILILKSDGQWEYLLLAVSASVAGFLVWNWEPATIFLGDVGSGFLGFIIGVIALITSVSTLLNIWTWLILLSVFITDATWTLFTRIITNQDWLHAHNNHAYQILSRAKKSHSLISQLVIAINLLWLGPIAFFATLKPEMAWFLTILAYAPLIYACWYVQAGVSQGRFGK